MIRFDSEAMNMIANFTSSCLICRFDCPFKPAEELVVHLQTDMRLVVFNFEPCKIPSKCLWFNQHFDCRDLYAITKLLYKE